jgi:hypothetical protein
LGEATDRPEKPVKMSSLWYLEGSVPKGRILSYTIAMVGEYKIEIVQKSHLYVS